MERNRRALILGAPAYQVKELALVLYASVHFHASSPGIVPVKEHYE